MREKSSKKPLLWLAAGALCASTLLLTGCNPLDLLGVQELKNEDAQKEFLKEAEQEFEDQEGFKVEGKGTQKDDGEETEMELTMKAKGDDLEMEMDSDEMSLHLIALGDYTYWGAEDDWIKMKSEDTSEYSESFTEIKDDFEDELVDFDDKDWEDEKIKYEGVEEVDGVKCHKFSTKDKDDNPAYLWIDGKTKLMKKYELKGDDDKGTFTVTYDNIKIEEPDDYEDITDLSDTQQLTKMGEIFQKMQKT